MLVDATQISSLLLQSTGMDKNSREAIANNVKRLMDHHGHNQTALAKKSGVSQRTISNVIRPDSAGSLTLESMDAIARAYGLQTWHIMLPNAPLELLVNSSLEKLVDNYMYATREGRDMITRVSAREAEIAYEHGNKKASGG